MTHRRAGAAWAALWLAAAPAAAAPAPLHLQLGGETVEVARATLRWGDGRLEGELHPVSGGRVRLVDGRFEAADDAGGGALRGDFRADWEAEALDGETAARLLLQAGEPPRASGRLDARGELTWPAETPPRVRFAATLHDGVLRWLDVRLAAPLHVEGRAVLAEETRLPEVRVRTPRLDPAGPAFEDVELALRYADRRLDVRTAEGIAFGVAWTGAGNVRFEDGHASFELSILLDTPPAGPSLEVATPEGRPFGRFERVRGELHAHGVWTRETGDLDHLEGQGRVEVGGGVVEGRRILPAVWNALAGAVPLLSLPRLPAFLEQPTRLDSATATFEVRSRRVHVTDLRVVTGDYTANLAGHADFDGALGLDGQVKLTALGIRTMLKLSGVEHRRPGRGLTAIPIAVRGTLSDPRVEAKVTRIPLQLIRAFFGYALPL